MNRAMQSAEAKGRKAAEAGEPITANPYGDARTYSGSVTFARGFWKAWRRGYENCRKSQIVTLSGNENLPGSAREMAVSGISQKVDML